MSTGAAFRSFYVIQLVSGSSVTGSPAKLCSWQGCAGTQVMLEPSPWPFSDGLAAKVCSWLCRALSCLTHPASASPSPADCQHAASEGVCCKCRAVLPSSHMMAADDRFLRAASSQACAVACTMLGQGVLCALLSSCSPLLAPAVCSPNVSINCLQCCDKACFSVCRFQAEVGTPAFREAGLMWTTMSEAAAPQGTVTCTSDSSCASW